MKKLIITLLAIVMATSVMAFTLTGCGQTEEKETTDTAGSAQDAAAETATPATDITGEWVLTSIIDTEGNTQTLDEYCAAQGVDISGMECTFTFTDDGKVVGSMAGFDVEGSYAIAGQEVTTTFETGAYIYTLDETNTSMSLTDANTGLTSVMTKK